VAWHYPSFIHHCTPDGRGTSLLLYDTNLKVENTMHIHKQNNKMLYVAINNEILLKIKKATLSSSDTTAKTKWRDNSLVKKQSHGKSVINTT